jgi:hypothetical protein
MALASRACAGSTFLPVRELTAARLRAASTPRADAPADEA